MNNKDKAIGVFDSGLGGIAILKEVRKRYPNNDYVYIGDNKNLPYGNKSKDELIDLLYTVYHKDSANQSENIASGDFLSLLVDGDDKLMNLPHEARLDWILYETQKRLEMELSTDKAVDNDIKARANLAIQKITELRNEIAGYYKDESDKDIQFEFFDS